MKIDKLPNKSKCFQLTKKGEQCKNWRPRRSPAQFVRYIPGDYKLRSILLCKYHSNLMTKQYDANKKYFQSKPITKLTPARLKY